MNEMRKLMEVAELLHESNKVTVGSGRGRVTVDYNDVSPENHKEVERLTNRIDQLATSSTSASFEQSRANRELIRSITKDLQKLGARVSYPR